MPASSRCSQVTVSLAPHGRSHSTFVRSHTAGIGHMGHVGHAGHIGQTGDAGNTGHTCHTGQTDRALEGT